MPVLTVVFFGGGLLKVVERPEICSFAVDSDLLVGC
jgi:hypothetical protein